MRSPWLDIPLQDYERHMALPQVAQAQLLSAVLAEALTSYQPRTVAVLGCAGGNGFERLADSGVERMVGVDINPDYVEAARERFADRIPGLELIAADVRAEPLRFAPVELVLAGLLFEYVDPGPLLARIRTILLPGGTLRTVVQLPGAALQKITPSPYTSLAALSPVMHLVPPELLAGLAADHGYIESGARTVAAAGGKQFRVQDFRPGRPGHGRNRPEARID